MQLENVRLTIDDVARLSRTGNFATLLPDSREKYNKARLKTDERNYAEKWPCVCPQPIRNFSSYFEQNCHITKDSRAT